MGICETKNNTTVTNSPQPEKTINTEPLIRNSFLLHFYPIKSISKIIIDSQKNSSGFLIKLFKDEQSFYFLMTNRQIIDNDMVKERQIINVYYDCKK